MSLLTTSCSTTVNSRAGSGSRFAKSPNYIKVVMAEASMNKYSSLQFLIDEGRPSQLLIPLRRKEKEIQSFVIIATYKNRNLKSEGGMFTALHSSIKHMILRKPFGGYLKNTNHVAIKDYLYKRERGKS